MKIELICEQKSLPEGMEFAWQRVGDICLALEGLEKEKISVSVTVVGNEEIQEINCQQRGIDRPTDVLSFPTVRYPRGKTARDVPQRLHRQWDAETGCCFLGDLVISLPKAREQAQEYGHSLFREAGFLLAHGMLHLLGYDHETEQERVLMREKENETMEKAGLSRELTDGQLQMIELARKARENAYTPYSHFHVGACVKDDLGRLFTGCNVENASYGLTLCAERNAIATAVAQGARSLHAIAVSSEGAFPYPCGACRQVMREFGENMEIILAGDSQVIITSLPQLLPMSFGPDFVNEVKQ